MPLYVTVGLSTGALVPARSSKVEAVIVRRGHRLAEGRRHRVAALTPVAPLAGDVAITVGAVVSGPVLVVKTTSTQ